MVLHSGGQSGGASWWRVCYQRGRPRLVYYALPKPLNLCIRKGHKLQLSIKGADFCCPQPKTVFGLFKHGPKHQCKQFELRRLNTTN